MIRFRENFGMSNLGNMPSLQKMQQQQAQKIQQQQQRMQAAVKKKQGEAQKNIKKGVKSAKKTGIKVKHKIEEWLRGKKGEAINKNHIIINNIYRNQHAEKLKGKLDDAKNFLKKCKDTKELDEAHKNYHTFTKGGLWYQNYLEKKGGDITQKKEEAFKDRMKAKTDVLKTLIKSYTQRNDTKNLQLGVNETTRKNIDDIAKKVNFGLNTKNVNNRMSDWYEAQNEYLDNINWYVSRLYWIILIVMSILIIVKFKLSNKKMLAASLIFILIPFLLSSIIQWLFNLNTNNCPSYVFSLGFEAGGSKTCQVKRPEMPVDCVMGDWTPCSAECGGYQTREILMEEMYGGKACGPTRQECSSGSCGPGPHPPPPPPDDITQNVLVEMPKQMWLQSESMLQGAELKDEDQMCTALQNQNYNQEQHDLLKKGEGDIKNLGKKVWAEGKQIYDDPKAALKKAASEIKSEGGEAAHLIESDIHKLGQGTLDKLEKKFNISLVPCVGKYCR